MAAKGRFFLVQYKSQATVPFSDSIDTPQSLSNILNRRLCALDRQQPCSASSLETAINVIVVASELSNSRRVLLQV